MGEHTAIEWSDSTLNLQMGCDGCELWNPKVGEKTCYAGQIIERYGGTSKGYPESFDRPKLFPERLKESQRWKDLTGTVRPDKPWLNGLPRLIFLDDMGDTFTESLPLDWLAEHLPVLVALPHIIILLTKRANRMLQFSKKHPFPKNFWLLTSVTSAANYNRIEQLMQVRGGSILGISYEPAWGPLDLNRWLPCGDATGLCRCGRIHPPEGKPLTEPRALGWVISGGSSGATAKPAHPDWFRNVRDQCHDSAGCAFFHKQNGEWLSTHVDLGATIYLRPDGQCVDEGDSGFTESQVMRRVGKKAAGALLDGREWREFPLQSGAPR